MDNDAMVAEADVDGGFDGASVEAAETLWACLPQVRKWTSLATHEKALVIHTLARHRHQSETGAALTSDGREAVARESTMIVIERDNGKPTVWCDAEIADIVRALNSCGLKTVASCSGHGHRPGIISLADGRELVIARDYAEARKIDALFPININGEEK